MTEGNKGPDAVAFPVLPDELTVMVARVIHELDRDAFGTSIWEALDEAECAWYLEVGAPRVIKALQPYFQAMRRETIEECAKRAEQIWDADQQGAHGGEQANRTASAIRALAKEGENAGE